MTATNSMPWFVGDRAYVPGFPFEWVLMLLVGEYAVIGKLAEAQVLGMGSFTRMVPVERLVRPDQWDAANLRQVEVVTPPMPWEVGQTAEWNNHYWLIVLIVDRWVGLAKTCTAGTATNSLDGFVRLVPLDELKRIPLGVFFATEDVND